jgi:Tfp pilus assembly major pilin PilA
MDNLEQRRSDPAECQGRVISMKHHELIGSLVLLVVIGILMILGFLYFKYMEQVDSYITGSIGTETTIAGVSLALSGRSVRESMLSTRFLVQPSAGKTALSNTPQRETA